MKPRVLFLACATAAIFATLPAPARAADGPLRISQAFSAEERTATGLNRLTSDQVAILDALYRRASSASLARTLLAPPTFIPLAVRARIAETQAKRSAPEIHGSFTLGFATGSGGYSEKFGGMTLTYEDPARRFALSVSYSESHVKGGPGPYYARDPLYNPTGLDGLPRYSPEW